MIKIAHQYIALHLLELLSHSQVLGLQWDSDRSGAHHRLEYHCVLSISGFCLCVCMMRDSSHIEMSSISRLNINSS